MTLATRPLDLDPQRLPAHVAVIMDGNGRWATQRSLPRFVGHRQGVEAIQDLVRCCKDWEIPALTVFAFSTENWGRPSEEVNFLMALFHEVLQRELQTMVDEGVCLRFIGETQGLPANLKAFMAESTQRTAHNRAVQFTVALNYGGRQEIVHAVQDLARKVQAGHLIPEQITEETLAQHLYTYPLCDPDLIIRSSGECRLSNFLLWQSAYTELYISPVLWPDFDRACFHQALKHFEGRKRRFGKLERP